MVAFETQGDLRGYLQRLGPLYSQYTQKLWEFGVRSSLELANASPTTLRKAGVTNDLHLENIKASAARENGVATAPQAPISKPQAADAPSSSSLEADAKQPSAGAATGAAAAGAGNTATAKRSEPAPSRHNPSPSAAPAAKPPQAARSNGQASTAAAKQGTHATHSKATPPGGKGLSPAPAANKRPASTGGSFRPQQPPDTRPLYQRQQWRGPPPEQAGRPYSMGDAGRGRPPGPMSVMPAPPPQYPPHFQRPAHGNSMDPMPMNGSKRQRTSGAGPNGHPADKYLPPHLPPHLPPPYPTALPPPQERGGGMYLPMAPAAVSGFHAAPRRPMQRLPPPQAPPFLAPPAAAPPLMTHSGFFGQSLPRQQAVFPPSWQQQQGQHPQSSWQQQQQPQQQHLQQQQGLRPPPQDQGWSTRSATASNYQEW